jgi:hypothetical protein
MELYRAYFRLPAVQIAGLLYFLIAGALTQIPLFNYLGYEFSALMTIPAAFCAGMVTITVAREHLTKPLSPQTWMFITSDYLFINGLLLAIPFVVMSANALVVKNCSFAAGITYYVLLPGITVLFSIALAMVTTLYFRHARTVFTVVVLALLSHIVVITYFLPQLFAYNTILGYFPGITYDETLNELTTLVVFREFTFVGALFLWIIFFIQIGSYDVGRTAWENIRSLRTVKPNRVLWGAGGVCAALIVLGFMFSARLGFEYSRDDIQERIGRRTESEHFILYYSEHNATAAEAKALKAKAEYQYWQVAERMETRERRGEKISVYLYPDSETKRKLIGAAATNVAKPWLHEIHLQYDSFDDTFRHELVHALAAEFGSPVIRASVRLGMNEGLAVAVDWNEGLFSPHEYAAALMRDSLLGDVEPLFHLTGFSTKQSTYAYLVAGSLSKYLIDRYGMPSFKKVFRSGNFVGIYAQPLSACIDDWKEFLATVSCSMIPPETIRQLFTQPSIFRKTCARVTAEKNKRGLTFLREKKYAEAEAEFASSVQDAKTSFALRGLFSAWLYQHKGGNVLAAYDALDHRSLLRSHPSLLLLAGDACMQTGRCDRAAFFYHRVEELHYSDAFTAAAAFRRLAAADTALVHVFLDATYGGWADSTRLVFLNARHDSYRDHPDAGVISYWLAMEYRRSGDRNKAGMLFENAAYAVNDGTAKYGASISAGDAYFDAQLYERALAVLWYAHNFTALDEQRNHLQEKSELIEFVQRNVNE